MTLKTPDLWQLAQDLAAAKEQTARQYTEQAANAPDQETEDYWREEARAKYEEARGLRLAAKKYRAEDTE